MNKIIKNKRRWERVNTVRSWKEDKNSIYPEELNTVIYPLRWLHTRAPRTTEGLRLTPDELEIAKESIRQMSRLIFDIGNRPLYDIIANPPQQVPVKKSEWDSYDRGIIIALKRAYDKLVELHKMETPTQAENDGQEKERIKARMVLTEARYIINKLKQELGE